MFWRVFVILFVGVVFEWKLTQCAPAEVGKTKEKVRAYEFGFNIEEQQHRHEKRDENGIVMGEFGFITADGIYHVTVYATDENGKFKILAMKSYPYANPEKKIMMAVLPPVKKPVVVPAIRTATPLDTRSCGACILTKTLTQQPADVAGPIPGDPESVFRPLSKTFNDPFAKAKSPPVPAQKGIPSSQPLPPKLPSLPLPPSLPTIPNAIGSTPSKATAGGAANGKEYQLTNLGKTGPSPQFAVDRQNKALASPDIGLRFGSNTIQRNPPSVGSAFNPPPQNSVFSTNNPPNAAAFPSNSRNLPAQGRLPQQNTFTQNTATISQQNAKESTFFQPLNKILPNEVGAAPSLSSTQPSLSSAQAAQNTIQPFNKNTLSQQTGRASLSSVVPSLSKAPPFLSRPPVTQNTIQPSTLSQQTGRVPSLGVTVTPQFTSSNAFTQSQLTNNINITPKTGLQLQNTNNGARTQTFNLPSTGKLTPSSQSIGKATLSSSGGGPLYRFKYVLDYNSHQEEGRIDGSKEGNYKTLNEDGIRRIIDYIANENGFQPNIKWERVPPNELPTGENKLKDYEFVWFN